MAFVLKNNHFTFNDQHFTQIQGTAMGTKMAPSYACLFMGSLEQRILNTSQYKPHLWVRYIDDIFGIWLHSSEEWNIFFEHLNSSHDSIKFVGSISDRSLPFLDVEVRLTNGHITTDLYTKPTDCHNYLPWNSCHPKGTKESIPYCEALRVRRICSEPGDFYRRLYELEGYLRSCNYPPKHIRPAFAKVRAMSRSSTLEYRPKETCTRITFPITFHPNLRNLATTVFDKYKNILLRDPSNKNIFKEPPMLAYRKPPNLRNLITRASVSLPGDSKILGFHNCSGSHPNNNLHKYNVEGNIFTSTVTKKSYKILQPLDCQTHNNIYLVTCKREFPERCRWQYVGETGRTHTERTTEHIRSIRNSTPCPVTAHFTSPFHSLADFSIQIIEHCRKGDGLIGTQFRKSRERYWQDTLKPQINSHYGHNGEPI